MRRRTNGLYDFYETVPRKTAALELRDFDEQLERARRYKRKFDGM